MCEKISSVENIKDLIRSRDSEEIAVLEQELYVRLRGKEDILFEIADDPQELINVRAMATRLFIARVFRLSPENPYLEGLADHLSNHKSALIRLGALLGYSDVGKIDCVCKYLSDPHSTLVEQVREILDDA